jgi:hypothetical protein
MILATLSHLIGHLDRPTDVPSKACWFCRRIVAGLVVEFMAEERNRQSWEIYGRRKYQHSLGHRHRDG